MDRLQQELREKNGASKEPPTLLISTPFTDDVMNTHYPQDLRIPMMRTYIGQSDPKEHIDMYYGNMLMLGVSDAFICRAFFATLAGKAAEWFRKLEPRSVGNFSQLADKFVRRFTVNRLKKKPYTYLNPIKQDVGEALSVFLQRWDREVEQVEPMEDQVAIHAFLTSLRSRALYYDLIVNPPKTYEEAITRPDTMSTPQRLTWPRGGTSSRSVGIEITTQGGTDSCNLVHPPEPIPEGTDKNKYCAFHKTKGHDTALRLVIEQLIQNGELDQFVKKNERDKEKFKKNVWKRNPREQSKAPGPRGSSDDKATRKKPVINVIYGGPEGGDSSRQRKQWARNLDVGSVHSEPREKKKRVEPIFFTDEDLPIHEEAHSDSLVITMDINGTDV
ncbi:PREDICTED: uncharacterized protein LOC109171497 [Ipomoea nil]|uniref:uncharacterized protein LOC109171497 n=1 Tax=Ipomoea nil TaxID=35883 RepID=UPI000901C113|nr:PREDICTED: uncharacterized protein LOC109171497 [Ipomoea nil]